MAPNNLGQYSKSQLQNLLGRLLAKRIQLQGEIMDLNIESSKIQEIIELGISIGQVENEILHR